MNAHGEIVSEYMSVYDDESAGARHVSGATTLTSKGEVKAYFTIGDEMDGDEFKGKAGIEEIGTR